MIRRAAAVATALAFGGCASVPTVADPGMASAPVAEPSITITFAADGCFGPCPIFTVEVSNTTTMGRFCDRRRTPEAVRSFAVPSERFRAFHAAILPLLPGANDIDPCMGCDDGWPITVTIKEAGKPPFRLGLDSFANDDRGERRFGQLLCTLRILGVDRHIDWTWRQCDVEPQGERP